MEAGTDTSMRPTTDEDDPVSVGLSKRQRGEPEKSFEVLETVDAPGPGSRQGAFFFLEFRLEVSRTQFKLADKFQVQVFELTWTNFK